MVNMALWHIAQLNVARLLHPIDHPATSEFVALLDPINQLAEDSPGFVWRLQDESGNATEIDVFGDPLVIINLSVWESIESFRAYVYKSAHLDVLRRRAEWFDGHEAPHLVLWWVPAGHQPTTARAIERLTHLRDHGPTAAAFTVRDRYPPPATAESA